MSEPLLEITDPGEDRYASLRLIDWWDQAVLQRANVMVLGVGALGNEVLKNLALLGVSHLLVVDFDVVEAANLSRSVLFRYTDKGRRKVDAVSDHLRELNPDVRVATFHGDIIRDLGLGVYRQMDVILGCVDNRATRLAINRACWRVGKPWIDGALDALVGMVRTFIPPDSACYECTMTEQDYQLLNLRYSCPTLRPEVLIQGRLPTTPISASITAALQVQQALAVLYGMEVVAGKAFYFNSHPCQTFQIGYNRRQDCYSHETYPEIIMLDAGVDDLTVGSFLALVAEWLGNDAILLSDQKLVRSLICPHCQLTELVYQPFETVVPSQISCLHCQSDRIPDVTNRLARNTNTKDLPLRQIGVPAFHILRATSSQGTAFFELSKDRQQILGEWNN